MANFHCPPTVGGKVYLAWGDKRLEASGSVKIRTGQVRREARATNSGRLVVTEEARVQEWEMDLWDINGADPMELWEARSHVNVTLVAESTGKRYLWTDAAVFGDPEHDLATGIVSGIKMATDQFSVAG